VVSIWECKCKNLCWDLKTSGHKKSPVKIQGFEIGL
jgi:hypothetical protein